MLNEKQVEAFNKKNDELLQEFTEYWAKDLEESKISGEEITKYDSTFGFLFNKIVGLQLSVLEQNKLLFEHNRLILQMLQGKK